MIPETALPTNERQPGRTIRLHDAIRRGGELALPTQVASGAMPACHDGPYYCDSTPVRCTAHWLMVFCKLWQTTGAQKWKNAAMKAIHYLKSRDARPVGASFFYRKWSKDDSCSGLIGQAWAIEALAYAAEALSEPACHSLAVEVFNLHPFLEREGVWKRVGADSSILIPDGTFNHQLWFAMAGALLQDKEIDAKVLRFMDLVGTNPELYRDGVVYHLPRMGPMPANWKQWPWQLAVTGKRKLLRRSLRLKSIGYHPFCLYAYALLYRRFPKLAFFESSKWTRMLSVTKSEAFELEISKSEYAFPYNPPGLELALVGEVFNLGDDYIEKWLSLQAARTYNSTDRQFLTKNSLDVRNSAARIYEAVWLENDYTINLPNADH